QMTGGNDGLNTVVPLRNDRYRAARPTLGIAANTTLKINDDLGFHPSLRGFARLLEAGRLAIVQGVGYPNPNRSHFESLDIWHTARREAVGRATGWLGRYLDASTQPNGERDARAIHVGGEVQPLALTSSRSAAASLRSADQLRLTKGPEGDQWRASWERSAATSPAASPASNPAADSGAGDLLQFVRTNSLSAWATSRRLEDAAQRTRATTVTYPGTDLGGKLNTVARLIDAGLATRVYYVMLDGFDTHSTQPGAHAGLLSQVGDAVSSFLEDMGQRGHDRRVMLMAFSEFGRRVAENASQGTDHGAAAPLFIAGGSIKPGVIGDLPSLEDLDDGDLKHHTDFRRVYATLLTEWLGIPHAQRQLTFAALDVDQFQALTGRGIEHSQQDVGVQIIHA
ncbi:MAG TPA: DUF1501 domain-containing protein, partial [Pirellulaceae bacterium]|nr:DUF1501 domain-containing protein [Pirellulaceae bacterium]